MSKHLDYQSLLKNIRTIAASSKTKAKRSKNQLSIESYWEIGKFIYQYLLDHESGKYGEKFFYKLSADTGIERTNLIRSVNFYRGYHIKDARNRLTWTHYKILLGIKDDQIRRNFEQQAVQENWDSRMLQKEVVRIRKEEKESFVKSHQMDFVASPKPEEMIFKRGRIGVYPIVKEGVFSREPLIDLGFHLRMKIPFGQKIEGGEIVHVNESSGQLEVQLVFSKDDCFTYSAYVERIIDQSAISAVINCGFGIFLRQKLALRGAEHVKENSPEALKIKNLCSSKLKPNQMIVVKIYPVENFTSYLADVYYLSGSTDPSTIAFKGECLNQKLLAVK